MGIRLSDLVENIEGKEEIAHYEQFLLFPQCFKSCLLLMRQNENLWSKGLTYKELKTLENDTPLHCIE